MKGKPVHTFYLFIKSLLTTSNTIGSASGNKVEK